MLDIINSVGNIVLLDVEFQDNRVDMFKIGANKSPLQLQQITKGNFSL